MSEWEIFNVMYGQLHYRCMTRMGIRWANIDLTISWSSCKINAIFTVMALNDLEKKQYMLPSAKVSIDYVLIIHDNQS